MASTKNSSTTLHTYNIFSFTNYKHNTIQFQQRKHLISVKHKLHHKKCITNARQ